VDRPRAGVHYPRSVGEFQAWFRTDADCLDYLEWLRWPAGFVCPACGHAESCRRRSRSRGLVFYRVLELAVGHEPVRYRDLIAHPQPRTAPPTPPQARGHPPSLERPPANRPWRTADQSSSA
jgi:transposase-like zinc ribbon protein